MALTPEPKAAEAAITVVTTKGKQAWDEGSGLFTISHKDTLRAGSI